MTLDQKLAEMEKQLQWLISPQCKSSDIERAQAELDLWLLRLVRAQRRVLEAQRDRLNPDIGEYPLVRDVLRETEQDLAAAEKEMVG